MNFKSSNRFELNFEYADCKDHVVDMIDPSLMGRDAGIPAPDLAMKAVVEPLANQLKSFHIG